MTDKMLIIKEAQKYLAKGQIDKAIAEWERLVNEAPDANAYNTIGDLYLRKGEKRSATDNFHKAANFFRAEGFSLKALALYKKIINIDPSDADSLAALGELSEAKGLITDAIKYYLSAADILSKDMKKDKFLHIYEKILALAPFNIPLRDKVAGLFLKEGLVSDAIREYLLIARLCDDREDLEQAKEYFSKVLDVHPDNKDALLGLSSVFEKTGDMEKAVRYAKKAVAAHPDNLESLERCARILGKIGAFDEALSCLSPAIELRPFDAEIRKLVGDIYLASGQRGKAWESYTSVVDAFVTDGKVQEAIDLAKGFRDIDPEGVGKLLLTLYRQNGDTEAVFAESLSIAEFLSGSGLRKEALSYYREALKIHPDDLQVKKRLAEQEIQMGIEGGAPDKERSSEDLLEDVEIFMNYGLFEDARAILEDLKTKEPDNADVHTRLKSVYLATEDREQAVTQCLILAELYGKTGEAEKREALLKEANEIRPGDPRLAEMVSPPGGEPAVAPDEFASSNFEDYSEEIAEAEFYGRQGLSQDALRIYQKLLNLFPDNEELRKKVASLQGDTLEPPLVGEGAAVDADEEFQFEEFTLPESDTLEAIESSEPQFDSDVLDIFTEFKKGLEKELEEEDFETHYNLGIAYKEMELLDDAIKEFQLSRKDHKYYVRSLVMLGICYMDKGLFPLAIDSFKTALAGIETRGDSYWGAKYDLGSAYEKNGNVQEAFAIFSEVYGWDSNFREVTEKLNRLKTIVGKAELPSPVKEKKDRVSYL